MVRCVGALCHYQNGDLRPQRMYIREHMWVESDHYGQPIFHMERERTMSEPGWNGDFDPYSYHSTGESESESEAVIEVCD